MDRYTFARAEHEKASPESAEHVTLEERDGILYRLSRDETRATRPEWVPCARVDHDNGAVYFFDEMDPRVSANISLAATAFWRRGVKVYNATIKPGWSIDVLRCRGRLTHPRSLRGDIRINSLDLGAVGAGEKGARKLGARFKVDVARMRGAVIAARGMRGDVRPEKR